MNKNRVFILLCVSIFCILILCSFVLFRTMKNENLYSPEDDSFFINLPSDDWIVTKEDTATGMYIFSLPASQESFDETGIDSDAIILYLELGEDEANNSSNTIPTTEEELKKSLGDERDYEIISFEGNVSNDGSKSNFYKLKFYDGDNTEGYIVSRADEKEGFLAAGEILYGGEELSKSVEESIKSVVKK